MVLGLYHLLLLNEVYSRASVSKSTAACSKQKRRQICSKPGEDVVRSSIHVTEFKNGADNHSVSKRGRLKVVER